LHTSAIVAVNATTGALVWSFQVVHHDIWDYDLACQPTVTTIANGNGGKPVVAFGTKTSFIFVLDAATGTPLHEVDEVPVAASDVPGEWTSPTQPFPKNRNFTLSPLSINDSMLWGVDAVELEACQNLVNNFTGRQNSEVFTPVSMNGSIQFPGPNGGINYPSCAIDPQSGNFICPVTNQGNIGKMIPQEEPYPTWCTPYTYDPMSDTPYKYCMGDLKSGINNNYPCTPPPWKVLTAVNVITGELVWSVPLGWDNIPGYLKEWGTLYQGGGPIITASGLVFVTGTNDLMLHVFNTMNGALLYSANLPDAGTTPITYKIGNTQYVTVVTVSGNVTSFALGTGGVDNAWQTYALVGGLVAGGLIIVFVVGLLCVIQRKKRQEEEQPLNPVRRV